MRQKPVAAALQKESIVWVGLGHPYGWWPAQYQVGTRYMDIITVTLHDVI